MKNLPDALRKIFENSTHSAVGRVIVDVLDINTDMSLTDDYTNLLNQIEQLLLKAAKFKTKSNLQ